MRSDAANLLSRLGQNKFRYQEFRDNFADMELWPLFEALIQDPRVAGDDTGDAHAASAPMSARPAVAEPAAPAPAAGLFAQYEAAAATAAKVAQGDDVRALLRQLNERIGTGGQ